MDPFFQAQEMSSMSPIKKLFTAKETRKKPTRKNIEQAEE